MKNTRPTVGMLVGYGPAKDVPTGFRVLEHLEKLYPNLRAIGFGPMPLRHDCHVPSCLEYHLHPAQVDIPKYYQQADCWIITSKSEGFGMPGIEAMASHCPVVSTRCGGPEDFVREGENGYLVDVGDAEAMADRIARVLRLSNEDWQRMSARSYEIAQEFDWDKSAEKLEAALYEWLDSEERDPQA
jgi:glycosyltransferase involved in cell wall biosynthesis